MWGGFEPVNDNDGAYRENSVIPVGIKGTSIKSNIFYFDIITGQTGGAGAMSTNLQVGYGTVPVSQGSINLARQYAAFTIGEDVLKSPGTVKDTFALYTQQSVNSFAMDQGRQLFSAGDSLIGTANATASTATTAFVFAASTNGDIDFADFVAPGTLIQIGSNAPVKVTAVTDTNKVTIATALTWTAADSVYKATPDGVVGGVEYVGLNGIIGTGAYGGITNPSWKSQVTTSFGSFAANGGYTTMNSTWVKLRKIGNPKVIFMNATLFNAYGNGLTSMKEFNEGDTLYAGWPRLNYMAGQGTIVLDYSCPDDHIYMLDPDSFYMAYIDDFHWLPGTNGALSRITGSANYEAIATCYGAAFNNLRGANGMISGASA